MPVARPPRRLRWTARRPRPKPPASLPPVTRLALQGGGAHGAYTWGVLDALLEADGPVIDAVAGTSAGAMNAVVLAHGLASAPGEAGRQAARAALSAFWTRVGEVAAFSSYHPPGGFGVGETVWRTALDVAGRLFPPTHLNPLGLRPLRAILEETVDFAAVRAGPVAVTVAATRVRDGAAHLFSGAELTVDAVLASACLPLLFPAVEIDGEAYWDGGYVANPPLAPLLGGAAPVELVLVPINPESYDGIPCAPRDILDRLGDLTFNAGLLAELAVLEREQAWRAAGLLSPLARPPVRLHAIRADSALAALGSASKLRPEPALLRHLFAVGRRAAAAWLADPGSSMTGD